MSKNDELNWSADLRRIALFLQRGNIAMAKVFIKRGTELYAIGRSVGGKEWPWWLAEINRKDRLKAAERALTWSLLLR